MTNPVNGLAAVDLGQCIGAVEDEGFNLDVRIVERGPVAAVLLASTDDGCDTVKTSDC